MLVPSFDAMGGKMGFLREFVEEGEDFSVFIEILEMGGVGMR